MKILMSGIVVIALALYSCKDKNKQPQKIKEPIPARTAKPIVSEIKSQLEAYRNEYYFGKRPVPKWLHVKKIIYPEKTLFVYKYEFYTGIDTLVFFKNSIKMNSENLFLLQKRVINFKGKLLEIKKYQYSQRYQFGGHRLSNLFINDSLGLIIEYGQCHPSGTLLREYRSEGYHELHNAILHDSVFFRTEFNYSRLYE